MELQQKSWWSGRELSLLSLSISAIESLLIWSVFFSGLSRTSAPSLVGMTDWAWILGGSGACLASLIAFSLTPTRPLLSLQESSL